MAATVSTEQNRLDKDKLLASLKARRAEEEANPTPKYFPLWALLDIYQKSRQESYLNYMEGADILIAWLAPIQLPEVPEDFNPMGILTGYELGYLADLIAGKNAGIEYRAKVRNSVLYTAIKHSLGERHE